MVMAEIHYNQAREVFEAQIREIMKYKWIESQKRGYDIGEGVAAAEWIMKYAAIFRAEWRKTHH